MTKEIAIKPEKVLLDIIEQIRAASVETFVNIQESVIGWHHAVGSMIMQGHELLTSVSVKKSSMTSLISTLADKTGKSERSLYRALAFARKFPTLESLPPEYQGKNVSFSKITNELLSDTPEVKAIPHIEEAEKCVCSVCGNSHKKRTK